MIRFLQTPGPVKKYLLGGMLLLISLSMVWYLVPNSGNSGYSFGGPTKGVVAQVDGGDISTEEVRQTARQMAQQDAQRYGEMAAKIMPFLIQQETTRAVDQLINRQALLSEAGRMGFRVTPEEVKDELQHGRYAATFFPGGTFIGETEYENMLMQGANLTPAKFEEAVANDILITKLQAFISGSASVSESEIHAEFLKQNSKVKFDYAILKQDDLRKGLHPTDEELKAFYASHQRSYANSVPEKRKVKYAVIETSKAEAGVQVTPDDLRAYYEQQRDQYRVPEQVKVSHIWIKMPLPGADGKIDDKAVAEAQHRADDLLKQLKGGAKFEDVAKKYSEDPGSSNVGGSLGWIGKGQMTAEFEKAAFSLPKGQISDVVKTLDGFHIIRVDDKQEAHVKPLDEVKALIEPILKHQKATQAAQKMADALLKAAQAQGLDAAAATQGVPVINSDFFSRKDMLPGLGPASQFMDAVFSATEKSPPAEAAASQGMVVFQLVAVKPAATPTFEEIRSRVEEEFKSERSSTLLAQKIQELSDRAKAEHDLKRAAKELGATVKTSDFVLPDAQVPDVGSMSGQAAVAFNMKAGEISGPINDGPTAVVLEVIENQQPTDADYAAKRDQIRDQMLLQKQQERFGLFVAGLIDEMTKTGKIKKNPEEIKTLTKNGSEQGM
jgi:peptidyl-prolyl cis-trans isomerase D